MKVEETFDLAGRLFAEGRVSEAEKLVRELAEIKECRESALRALTDIYLQTGQPRQAIDTLVALTEEVPDELFYYARLAALLESLGDLNGAIGHYERLLARQPGLGTAHYNLALLYRKLRRFEDAKRSYQAAIDAGIDRVEEVYSNLGVLYSDLHQRDKAQASYEQALEANDSYIPAMFNLAGLLEEGGNREQATQLYERILEIDPRHWQALARLAYGRKAGPDEQEIVKALRKGINDAGDDVFGKESLYFALGKVLDEQGRFKEAFDAYVEANELGKLRCPQFDKLMVREVFGEYIQWFSPARLELLSTARKESPIFICGMFRSGTTLVEQMLASHPAVAGGGELDYISWIVEQQLKPFPEMLTKLSEAEMSGLADEYLDRVRNLFPDVEHITDKRPDNFLYLGLIKILFPGARIIYTTRDPMDNCLSVYFQQMANGLSYSTDLEYLGHYYKLHRELMSHWIKCFPGNIHTVSYEELVGSPEPVLRKLLDFLGLEWDDRCLEFTGAGNLVKTPSVWQVREGLYTTSAGRWRNYEPYLDELKGELGLG